MKKILYILAFIFFGLFGVVNEGWSDEITYELTIDASYFNGTSYAANNNEKTSIAICVNDASKKMSIKWTSYQVYQNSGMQWQKGKGYIYNSTNLGTINSIVISSSGGSFMTYYGTSEHPTSVTSSGTGKGFFTIKENGVATGKTSNIVIRFTITEILPTYKIYLDSCGTIIDTLKQTLPSDSVILPMIGTSKDCELNKWEFIGWTKDTINHRNLLNGKYKPNSNDTLYSMYRTPSNVNVEYITDTLLYNNLFDDVPSESSYHNFSNKSLLSGVKYSGVISVGDSKHHRIQMTADEKTVDGVPKTHTGIINVTSNMFLYSLNVSWNTETTDGHALKVYTSNTPFGSPEDLYDYAKCLDSISKGVTDLDLDGSKYIGLRSKTGAIFFDKICITWSTGIGYDYSIHPKCFSTNISVAEWFEDSVKFDINGKDSLYSEPFTECDSIRMVVTNENNDTCIRWFHVPIFAEGSMSVEPECDVVVLNGKTFTPQDGTHSKGVYVYPGGTLIVNNEYTIDSLVLRRDNDDVPYFSYNGTLNTDKLYFELRTDGTDWRWLTLPDTLKSELINGKDEAIIRYYDDSIRAVNGRGGWIDEYKTHNKVYTRKYAPGQGCLFGVDSDKKIIYSFELNTNILSKEDEIKNVPVHAYKNPIVPPNDLGWNVVGNPFMDSCYISSNNPIRVGQLIHNDSDPWNGGWTISDTIEQKLKYIIEYQNGEYVAIPLTKNGIKLKPYTSFFVQIDTAGSENKILRFTKDAENYGRAQQRTKQISEETFLQLNVNNKQTGCFISNKYNDEYEINADLESFDNQLYQTINGYKLIYSAINDSIIEHGINVLGYGEVSLNDITDINSFEEINIFYNEHWYNLLNGDTPNIQGNFILFARRNKNDIPTGLNETIINTGVKKFIHNDYIYVVRDNEIYSILGEKIR